MFIYVSNVTSIEDALSKLKRGMAFGTQPTVKAESKAVIPFMEDSDRNVSFHQETIIVDGLKSIKDSIRQDNSKIIDGLERMTAVIDNFHRDRSRDRGSDYYDRDRDR